jgi:hypothetical protein
MAVFSGFYESHAPPPLGDACDSTAAVMAIKTARKLVGVTLSLC